MTGLRAGVTASELVPGDPDDLARLVARCGTVAQGLGGAATRVRAVDAGDWVGPAGDAFRSVVDVEPGRYDDAAQAFGDTGSAVRAYVTVLREAQSSARTAVTLHEQGDAARAESMLAEARQRVAAAGVVAARAIAAAWQRAPREPHWWEKAGHFVAEIGRGAWEATAGLAEFTWQVSTVRMVVDPAGWMRDMEHLGEGLCYGVQHPVELGKAVLDWDTWQESPGRAIGHLLPDLVLTLATAGGGATARAARGVEAVEDVADVATTFQRLDRLGEGPERLGYLQRARNLLSGETLPEPNTGAHSPAGLAAGWQAQPPYGGVDRWFDATLRRGDILGAGSLTDLHLPFSGFAVPREVVDEVGADARQLFEGLQVKPFEGAYRDQVTVFRATRDIPVAVSYAMHNPQFGAGGLRQLYVHQMQQLVDAGHLEVVERRALEHTLARLDPALAGRQ